MLKLIESFPGSVIPMPEKKRELIPGTPPRFFGPISPLEARALIDQLYSSEMGEGLDGILMDLFTGVIEPREAIYQLQCEAEETELRNRGIE